MLSQCCLKPKGCFLVDITVINATSFPVSLLFPSPLNRGPGNDLVMYVVWRSAGKCCILRHIIHGRPPYSLPAISSSNYPIIMLTNERMLYSKQQQEQCVHWLAMLWDIWMTIGLGDHMVAYHGLSPHFLTEIVVLSCHIQDPTFVCRNPGYFVFFFFVTAIAATSSQRLQYSGS